MTGHVTKPDPHEGLDGLTGETGWHGARQRATRQTLPRPIAGRLAQKYRRRTGVRAGLLERALAPE